MTHTFNILPAILMTDQTKDHALKNALGISLQSNAYSRESVEDGRVGHTAADEYAEVAARSIFNLTATREIEIARQLGNRAWKQGHRHTNALIDSQTAHLLARMKCSAVALYAYACLIGGEYDLKHKELDGTESTVMTVRVRPNAADGMDKLDISIRLDEWTQTAWWEGSFLRVKNAGAAASLVQGKEGEKLVDLLPEAVRHLFVNDLRYEGGDHFLRVSGATVDRIIPYF